MPPAILKITSWVSSIWSTTSILCATWHRVLRVVCKTSTLLQRTTAQQGHSQRRAWAPQSKVQSPLEPPMKWQFVQESMESCYFESWSAPAPLSRATLSPPYCPLILKSGYAPAAQTNTQWAKHDVLQQDSKWWLADWDDSNLLIGWLRW